MDRDRDGRSRRYDDGEVVRYGAGESWRPTPRGGERSPRRARSPVRDRGRTPPPRARSPRPRSPIVAGSDSYVPGRYPPRRRSRSGGNGGGMGGGPGGGGGGDRYRRERSRDRESPRRRERTRSPLRRSPPPPPLRRSPMRRDSPLRENRYDRPRSPLRREWDRDRQSDWERERDRERDRDRDRDWNRDRDRMRERELDRRDDRRSHSPFNRDRRRERTPPGRTTPLLARAGSYRPRSPSPNRPRGDRYQSFRRPSPPRDSGISSAITSRPASERASPRPHSTKARSPPPQIQLPTREASPRYPAAGTPLAARDTPKQADVVIPQNQCKSPPRGPAALRAPPTGPSANRSHPAPVNTPNSQRYSSSDPTSATPHHPDVSPTIPPSGPRGYVPPLRTPFPASRGGRGSGGGGGGGGSGGGSGSGGANWNASRPSGQSGSAAPSQAASSPGPAIPTGPRVTPPNTAAGASGAPAPARPFNPPTGPSAQHAGGPRQTLAQSLLSTMPPIVGGGKLDPSMTPLLLGVTKEVEPHYRKLKDEEEKIREELRVKQERLRKSLYTWNRLDRDTSAWEVRSDLSEKSMKNLAGEGIGGAAF